MCQLIPTSERSCIYQESKCLSQGSQEWDGLSFRPYVEQVPAEINFMCIFGYKTTHATNFVVHRKLAISYFVKNRHKALSGN